ncbi:MAG: hypothetical protein F082_1608 [bacterium F082]|nr:MAG: hypothetical protein F082_1608 [bacterium F082]
MTPDGLQQGRTIMKKILSVLVAVLLMTSLFAQSSSRILNDIRDGQIRGMLVKSRAHRAAAPGAPTSKATYNLTMTDCQSHYYEEDGDWYFGMSDGNAQFYFDIYAENIVSGHTYTFSDMDDYYSYAKIGGEEYDYTAASFTYTLNADGTEHISAMATLSTGDIYYLTYDTPVAADTVEVVVPSAMLVDLTASNAVFQMRGTTADQRTLASVAINTSQVAGSYVSSDFNAYYTYMGFISADATDTTYAEFVAGEATVTATATGYTLEAYVLCDNNHCYHITMRYATNGINTHRCHRRCRPYRPQQYPECQHAQHKWSVQRCLHAAHRHHRGRQHPEDCQEVRPFVETQRLLSNHLSGAAIRPPRFRSPRYRPDLHISALLSCML